MLSQIPVRMAEGGEARAFSDDEVKQFIQSTYAQFGGPGVEAHKAIADAMAQYGVGVNQVARATGYTPREVEAEFMGQRAGERPVLDDPTGTAAGMSAAYRAAATAGGQQTVDDYYANLRKDAASYLANPNAPTGVDAYNLLVESGISTSDLRAAGVADEVLNKIFTVSGPIEQSKFVTPAGMTSAYERSPDLAFESQRLTALGQDGRGILDAQGRDYIANLQQGGIDAAERAQMLEYATERGYSFDDLLKAGVDPNVLFRDDGSAAAAAAAAEAERQRLAGLAAAEAERQRLAAIAAAEAERQRLAAIAAAEAAELERQRLAKLPTDEAIVAPGVTVGDMVKAVTPTYNAQQLQNIIKAAENQPAAAGTVANPIDTRGSAATGSQSGVSKFLETYNPAAPFVAPPYTAPTVYQPLPAQPDMFAAGQPALDPAFRESAPRTAIPSMPGQFEYTPAAKLRPATGSGFTFTPPSVTTRPRSLLSPLAIQGYGGTMSKSQIFALNRSLVDRNLRDMLGATPALRNASTYNLLRNRVMAGEFGADPARVFDPTTTEGQKFQAFLASLAGTAPAQAAATGAAGTVADAVIDIDQTDRQIAAGGGTTSGTTVAGGYAAPIDASPLAYGGYRLEPFSKGGAVKKSKGSAKDKLARFAEGGEARVGGSAPAVAGRTGRAARKAADPQTESRTMLERISNVARGANQAFYENVSKPAVGTAIDMTLGLGDLVQMGARYLGNRAGLDAGEFTSVAQPAKEALGVEDYNPYSVGGLGASILPFATAGRAAAATTRALPGAMLSPTGSPSAARQLSSMFPNLGRETGAYVAGETGAAAATAIAPDSTLAEVAGAALGSTGASMAMGSPPAMTQMLPQRPDSTERTYQLRPTGLNPFVGRLDRFIGTELQGTTTLPALVSRLQGKFRDYDIQRVEEIAKNVDPNAKFKPNEILDMLRVNYDPSAFQVQQRSVESSYSFYTQDDPFAGEPDSALERSVIMLNRDNMPQNAVSSKAAEFAKDSIDRLSVMRLVASSGAGDDISNILRGNTLARYTAPLVDFLSYNRGSSFDNEVMPIIARLDRDVTEFQEMQGAINTSINEFSPQNFFRSPSFSSALRESKRRQEAEGGVNPRQILKQAEMEAFHSTYEGLVNSYLSLAPDMRQLFENLENPQYVTENEQIIPFLTDNAIPKLQKSLARETRRLESTIKDSFLDIADNQKLQNALKTASAGKMPGSNPLYAGRHQSLTPGVSNLISLTRATDVKADIPGMGNNVKGIYLHELQSDLVNDIRKAGGPRNMTPEQLQERLGQTEAAVDSLGKKEKALKEEFSLISGPVYQDVPVQRSPQVQAELDRLRDEIETVDARLSSQIRIQRSIESRLAGLPPRFGALADEPFVGASNSPRVLQQLMIKAAVKAAVDRGLNFVALTSPEKSKEAQLYAMTPQNAKDVVKDLGEGFVLKKLDISSPSGQTGFSTMGIVWDQQDAAGREALNRMYTQGVPFKEGGLVDSKVADEVLRSQEELLREQLARIDNTPSTRTPERAPTPEQTESRAMLERLDAATPVERAVFESTGMEPGLDRAMMLPFAGSREEGNLQLAAPGFVYDAARAFVTPGMAARGQQVSDEDLLNTAMNVMGGGAGASRVAGPRTASDEVLLGMGVGSRDVPTAADDLAALTAKAQTETPEFKNWFGNSAITRSLEPNGKPRRLYHITPKNFDAFDVNRPDAVGPMSAESGPVIFMSDDPENQPAAHNVGGFKGKFKEGANVMPVYASIQNPLFIDYTSKAAERARFNLGRGWPYIYTQEDVSKLQAAGYDGVFLVADDGPNEIVAFRPEQVKSAIGNEGTFDPANPVITKAKGGAVTKNNVERMRNDNRKYL
jgi:hypothetical protein